MLKMKQWFFVVTCCMSTTSLFCFDALHQAVIDNDTAITQQLLDQGTSINEVSIIHNGTPLHLAVRLHNHELMRLLVSRGADVNALDVEEGVTPLSYAAQTGDTEAAQFLLQKGARIHKGRRGKDALYAAIQGLQNDLAQEFIKLGAQLTDQCIQIAAMANNVAILKYAVSQGISIVNLKNPIAAPLHAAAMCGSLEAAQLLVEQGADVNARMPGLNMTPFHCAAASNNIKLLEFLKKHGADIHAHVQAVETYAPLYETEHNALDCAVEGHAYTAIEWLLKNGFSIHQVSVQGNSLMHVAAATGNLQMIEFLVHKGLGVGQKNKHGYTPAQVAMACKNNQALYALTIYGSDINSKDTTDNTILIYAVRENDEKCAEMLLAMGANPLARNNEGKMALDYARSNKKDHLAQHLLYHHTCKKSELNKCPFGCGKYLVKK